jgi:hypothetical protein
MNIQAHGTLGTGALSRGWPGFYFFDIRVA